MGYGYPPLDRFQIDGWKLIRVSKHVHSRRTTYAGGNKTYFLPFVHKWSSFLDKISKEVLILCKVIDIFANSEM